MYVCMYVCMYVVYQDILCVGSFSHGRSQSHHSFQCTKSWSSDLNDLPPGLRKPIHVIQEDGKIASSLQQTKLRTCLTALLVYQRVA